MDLDEKKNSFTGLDRVRVGRWYMVGRYEVSASPSEAWGHMVEVILQPCDVYRLPTYVRYLVESRSAALGFEDWVSESWLWIYDGLECAIDWLICAARRMIFVFRRPKLTASMFLLALLFVFFSSLSFYLWEGRVLFLLYLSLSLSHFVSTHLSCYERGHVEEPKVMHCIGRSRVHFTKHYTAGQRWKTIVHRKKEIWAVSPMDFVRRNKDEEMNRVKHDLNISWIMSLCLWLVWIVKSLYNRPQ